MNGAIKINVFMKKSSVPSTEIIGILKMENISSDNLCANTVCFKRLLRNGFNIYKFQMEIDKRIEIKQWNAVALWSWNVAV